MLPDPTPTPLQVVEYYHLDAVGSVRAVTDAQGQVIARHDFLPFGEELSVPSPPHDRRLFTGQERDFETALDYFHARQLRVDLGRFTTPDPLTDLAWTDPMLGATNAYGYVQSNPLGFIDPSGTQCQAGDKGTQELCNPKPIFRSGIDLLVTVLYPLGGIIPAGGSLGGGIGTIGPGSGEPDYEPRQPQDAQSGKDSWTACMKKSMEDFSLQGRLKDASGGKLGDSWFSSALLGSTVLEVAEFAGDLFSGRMFSAAGHAIKEGASEAVKLGAETAAKAVPNVTNVTIAQFASATWQVTVVEVQHIPYGSIAQGIVKSGLKTFSVGKSLWDMSVAYFAALTCSIGR